MMCIIMCKVTSFQHNGYKLLAEQQRVFKSMISAMVSVTFPHYNLCGVITNVADITVCRFNYPVANTANYGD